MALYTTTCLLTPPHQDSRNRNITATESLQIEVETAALVKAAEDITSLTRLLKEAWLFGQLDTIGPSEAEGRTDEHARLVAGQLGRLLKDNNMGESGMKAEET